MIKDIEELKKYLEDESNKIRQNIFLKYRLGIKDNIWDVDDIFDDIKQRIKLNYIEDLIYRIDKQD
ncbi:hypothetical protein H2684_03030 [Clostridium sp. cel8]|jgi:predicted small metal-binding protein|uniref:hypothetical protein n=1 Tax=unclassified Clostridium TaxID=2614128 RepID=UPI0015F436C8|nr:hypothetical protein [Clostridium sp. cel8]MBA5850290.1 hypothetical protein [Clostridium sp. cel8]